MMRAGGSQIGCPNGGWVNGALRRAVELRAQLLRPRPAHGARVQHDPRAGCGAPDGVCNVPRWPGDNGNWTEYTTFLNRIIADARADGMTGSDVRWDIWNEPNIFFWGRSQAQYFEMVRRGTQQIRAAHPGRRHRGPELRRRARAVQRVVRTVPRLRPGQQRRPEHPELARPAG